MNIESLQWKDLIITCAAVLGAVLGVMNTWNTMSQRRLRLRVTPVYICGLNGEKTGFAIGMLNLSAFPVTVEELGFLQRNGTGRIPMTRPFVLDNKPWPRRLEPRESVTVHFDPFLVAGRVQEMSKAYARTSCGSIMTGDSAALRQLLNIKLPQNNDGMY